MDLRGRIKLVAVAVLGLFVAAVVGLLSNAVTSDSDGLSAEPTNSAVSLAPRDARTRRRSSAGATAPTLGARRPRRDD